MTPMMPIVSEKNTKITRGCSVKLGLAQFSSIDFFCSRSEEFPVSQADAAAEMLSEFCYKAAHADLFEYKQKMEALAQQTLGQPAPEPQENPFRVKSRPAETKAAENGTKQPADETKSLQEGAKPDASGRASNQVEKQELQPQPDSESSNGKQQAAAPEATDNKDGKGKKGVRAAAKAAAPKADNPAAAAEPVSTTTPTSDSPKPTASAPTTANGNFKASDSDIPENLGGTSPVEKGPDTKARTEEAIRSATTQEPGKGLHVVPPKPAAAQQLGQVDRIKAMIAALATDKRPAAVVAPKLKEFARAFVNKSGNLPDPPDQMFEPVIPILEFMVESNPGAVLADPHSAGLKAGVSWNKFVRHIDKWPPLLKEVAVDVARWRYPDEVMDLLEFLDKTAKLGNLDQEMYIFLKVFRASSAGTAMKLKEYSDAQKIPMTAMVSGINPDDLTEQIILSIVSGAEVPPAKPAAAPAPEPEPERAKLWDD